MSDYVYYSHAITVGKCTFRVLNTFCTCVFETAPFEE